MMKLGFLFSLVYGELNFNRTSFLITKKIIKKWLIYLTTYSAIYKFNYK